MTPEALRDALTQPWAHGAHLDGQGLRFAAPIVLDGLVLRSFDLSGAVFEQGLSARGAVFRGMAWLKGATLRGALDLTGAVFRNDLRLDGLAADTLRLTGARCEGVIDLDAARLGALHLGSCVCLANVSMARAEIGGALDLRGSDLMGGIWARGAQLGPIASDGLLVEGRSVDFQSIAKKT